MKLRARVFVAAAAAFIVMTSVFPTHAGEPQPVLEDSRVVEVLAMAEGNLSLDVILTKVEDIGSFPELSGTDLVFLKQHGVPDRVLVRMIELEQVSAPAPTAVAPPPPPAQPAVAPIEEVPQDTGAIQVVIERPFMITFYEVAVDGEMLAHRGKLWEGTSDPGQKIKRPSRVGRRKDTLITALDVDVTPGLHEVAVGFAVTWVEDDADDNDEWGEYAHEFYVNRGVRAIADDDAHLGQWGMPTSATCDVQPGQTCTVTATLEKRAPTAFGGIPVYSVSYETTVR